MASARISQGLYLIEKEEAGAKAVEKREGKYPGNYRPIQVVEGK